MAEKTSKEIKEEQREFNIKALLSQKRQPFQGVGAGFHNGVLYYGTNIQDNGTDKTAVITSDKQIYVAWNPDHDEIKNVFGLNYRFDFFGDLLKYDLSYKALNDFLYGTPEDIGLKTAYELILEKQKKYVWHPDAGYHETIACSILSTYFIQVFASKGRDYFCAEKESGKTQQLNIYAGLAFHGLLAGNISGASIYRIIESIKPTLLIDDFDKIPDEQKVSFDQSYRTGYKKGMRAIRADDKRPIGFDLFAHMAMNNIGGLDDVSDSRSCKHSLMKCPDNFEAPEIENELDKWQQERDAVYLCGLLHWKEVKETYDALEEKSLKNRALEIDKATLTIAKLVGQDVYTKVLDYITTNNARRKMTDLENDWIFHALDWWKKNALEQWKSAGNCAEEIAGICLNVEDSSPFYKKELKAMAWHIGKALGRYPVIETRMSRGTKQYWIDKKIWVQVAKARGYENAFDITDFMPTTTTTTTIPTIPTIPTTDTQKSGVDGGHGGNGGQKGGVGNAEKQAILAKNRKKKRAE